MAGAPKILKIEGPFRGLEMDESRQTPQHDEISINVDYSRGRKEARKGFERWCPVTAGTHPRMHLSESANGLEQWLLIIGTPSSDSHVYLTVLSHNGDNGQLPNTGGSHDLTTLFGEPYSARKRVGFLNVTIPYGDSTGIAGNRKVTLISTEYTTYVFDPCNPDAVIRQLSTSLATSGGDAMRRFIASFTVWSTVPHGPILEGWQAQTFYAGFRAGEGASLLAAVAENDTTVPRDILTANLAGFVLQPCMIVWSDNSSPADVGAPRIIQTPNRLPVTGLKVLGENLYVFTGTDIYVLINGGSETAAYANAYVMRRVVSGTGCIAPESIVENQGVLYFLASDGIYAFGGLSAPGVTKVSVPIDPIFSHNYDVMAVPNWWSSRLGELGWPFRANRGDLQYSEGLYVPSQKQIWWSLPIEGRPQHSFAATLVYDLVHRAWSVWCKAPASVGASPTLTSCMVSGAVVQRVGQADLVWCVDARGHLSRYGHHRDVGAAGDDNGVPLLWRTPRILPAERLNSTFSGVKLKMLSMGKTPAAGGPTMVLTGESSSWDDDATETKANLTTHPWTTDFAAASNPFLDGLGTLSAASGSHASPDWFDSATECSIKSPSIRIGIKDDPLTPGRGNMAVVLSFSVKVDVENDP